MAWPGYCQVDNYLRGYSAIVVVGEIEKSRMCWRVPNRWLLQLYSAGFWYDEASRDLGVPKLLGYRLGPKACPCSTCSSMEEWDFKDIGKLDELREVRILMAIPNPRRGKDTLSIAQCE